MRSVGSLFLGFVREELTLVCKEGCNVRKKTKRIQKKSRGRAQSLAGVGERGSRRKGEWGGDRFAESHSA
jgi:hypothetical protein